MDRLHPIFRPRCDNLSFFYIPITPNLGTWCVEAKYEFASGKHFLVLDGIEKTEDGLSNMVKRW